MFTTGKIKPLNKAFIQRNLKIEFENNIKDAFRIEKRNRTFHRTIMLWEGKQQTPGRPGLVQLLNLLCLLLATLPDLVQRLRVPVAKGRGGTLHTLRWKLWAIGTTPPPFSYAGISIQLHVICMSNLSCTQPPRKKSRWSDYAHPHPPTATFPPPMVSRGPGP